MWPKVSINVYQNVPGGSFFVLYVWFDSLFRTTPDRTHPYIGPRIWEIKNHNLTLFDTEHTRVQGNGEMKKDAPCGAEDGTRVPGVDMYHFCAVGWSAPDTPPSEVQEAAVVKAKMFTIRRWSFGLVCGASLTHVPALNEENGPSTLRSILFILPWKSECKMNKIFRNMATRHNPRKCNWPVPCACQWCCL